VTSAWKDVAGRLGRLAAREAPRILRGITKGRASTGAVRRDGRGPRQVPAARLAGRTLVYAPQLDGQADPGEVVWTWVPYEDDPGQGKDRPVLVVGRDGRSLLGLMLSSQRERDGQRNWYPLGPGAWDSAERPSWVRLDRVLEVDEDGIRREGAVLERGRFEAIAKQLRAGYGWG
jgi:hypothetical protein